jgi:hypothetical protein
MPGNIIFEYRCTQGHRTEKIFPPGTAYDKHTQIACPACLKSGEIVDAYLVFAAPREKEPVQ